MARQNAVPPGEHRDKRRRRRYYDRLEVLVIGILCFVFISLLGGRVIGVDGSSMSPTLRDRDQVIMVSLFYTPRQGDVVILTKSSFSSVPLVKRVVAVEGQTVDIDFARGVVYVDGRALDEPYTAEPTYTSSDVTFPVTVPEGCLFVMGDNRNASTDSRSSAVGMVDVRCVLGRVSAIILPVGRIGLVGD